LEASAPSIIRNKYIRDGNVLLCGPTFWGLICNPHSFLGHGELRMGGAKYGVYYSTNLNTRASTTFFIAFFTLVQTA
jgi:hypothetical protein